MDDISFWCFKHNSQTVRYAVIHFEEADGYLTKIKFSIRINGDQLGVTKQAMLR